MIFWISRLRTAVTRSSVMFKELTVASRSGCWRCAWISVDSVSRQTTWRVTCFRWRVALSGADRRLLEMSPVQLVIVDDRSQVGDEPAAMTDDAASRRVVVVTKSRHARRVQPADRQRKTGVARQANQFRLHGRPIFPRSTPQTIVSIGLHCCPLFITAYRSQRC